MAGIAATCAGLALLFPIAFPVLAAAAVFCYGAAAVIKFYQLHKKSKARRCQQAVLEKLKDDRQDPKNYLIWQHFCRNLFAATYHRKNKRLPIIKNSGGD